ncbi:MAG: hypothetical protein MUC58_04245 [Rhizobiaceae bacterium]|jgi:hypothetical protein|nr:hypothetical protein [Rhizobiaceae bacterium]
MNTTLKAILVLGSFAALTASAHAATLVNLGDAPVTIVVTEDGQRNEVTAAPAETVQFCMAGCFVTLPSGERQALTGTETLEITGANVLIK